MVSRSSDGRQKSPLPPKMSLKSLASRKCILILPNLFADLVKLVINKDKTQMCKNSCRILIFNYRGTLSYNPTPN